MQDALAQQTAGKLESAQVLYQEALKLDSGNFDALHMLGVVKLQLGDPLAGARHILDAIRQANIEYPPAYSNLGLCLTAIAKQRGTLREFIDPQLPESEKTRLYFTRDLPKIHGELPLVSVVMPCYNHERFVSATLQSVFNQTYPALELIIIDDGSSDASTRVIEEALKASPFPVRFQARGNLGAPQTINEGIALAQGHYVTVINSDDQYDADRIEALTRMLVASQSRWGFSGVGFIDDLGQPLTYGEDAMADSIFRHLDQLHATRSITAAFLGYNYSISTGNLFLEKSLWQEMGGIRDYRYVHDWDFCVRASLCTPPAVLFEPKYRYRIHGANTISESRAATLIEADKLYSDWLSEIANHRNEDPSVASRIIALHNAREWRLLEGGRGHLIKPAKILELASTILPSF